MVELVLRERCEHGSATGQGHFVPGFKYGTEDWCRGGAMVRLDPEQVVFRGFTIGSEYVGGTTPSLTVQDVIAALTEKESEL